MKTAPAPWLKTSAKFYIDDPSFLIHRWCLMFKRELADAVTHTDVWAAKCRTDDAIGMRCFAVEILFTEFDFERENRTADWLIHVCRLIARVGTFCTDRDIVLSIRDALSTELGGLAGCLTWVVAKPNEDFNYYRFLSERPNVTIENPAISARPAPIALKLLLEECKSESQRGAIRRLGTITAALTRFPNGIGGVKLHRAALFCGMSGAGKTWTAHQFARCLAVPTYATTVGSWSIRNSRADHSTTKEILAVLESGPACIVIDEVDKFRLGHDNSNWYRAVQDEIMMLAGGGDMRDFKPSAAATKNLKNSWFLFAGAFQELYRGKAGADSGAVMFPEQLESVNLTLEDIVESGWLPDELLNRMGWFIEVCPPSVDELSAAMVEVEQQAGVVVTAANRDTMAKQMFIGMQGFRGLSNYALRCAQQAVIGQAEAARRQEPPEPPPGPQNPSWF